MLKANRSRNTGGSTSTRSLLIAMILLMVCATGIASAETEQEKLARIAQQTNNPVGDLWLLFIQNDLSIFKFDATGENRVLNSLKFQPVTPFLLTEKWRMVIRPVLQLQSFETPSLSPSGLEWNREDGLGDTVLLSVLSPVNDLKRVWGFGLTQIFPTAVHDEIGGRKWGAGPAALWFNLGPKWVIGGVLQHWWDYAGSDNASEVELTDFQYVIRRKINPFFQVGTGPNIQYNWETEDWSVPIGIGLDSTTKWGNIPFRWGFDVEYYLDRFDTFGAEWNIRLFFIPVIGSPKWAQKPVFGK